MITVPYQDVEKWGKYSFLDILEINSVQYHFAGGLLAFGRVEDRDRAAKIWYCLTGSNKLGQLTNQS